jgi:hypothetical protein
MSETVSECQKCCTTGCTACVGLHQAHELVWSSGKEEEVPPVEGAGRWALGRVLEEALGDMTECKVNHVQDVEVYIETARSPGGTPTDTHHEAPDTAARGLLVVRWGRPTSAVGDVCVHEDSQHLQLLTRHCSWHNNQHTLAGNTSAGSTRKCHMLQLPALPLECQRTHTHVSTAKC